MPKLLYGTASPYGAKVRMAAAHVGFDLEAVIVDTTAQPPQLVDANPLGKVPTIITDDGEAIYDSRAILQYLDRERGGALFPRKPLKRTAAEQLEALADGVCDCLLAHVYERRSRPEVIVHKPWLDKQWSKVKRALDHLETDLPKVPRSPHGGHIALRATLGYLALRFAGEWEADHPKLQQWAARFDEKHPELVAFLPS